MLLLISMLGLIVLLVGLRDSATFQPLQKSQSYSNISHAMMDEQGAWYTIVNSKKLLTKTDANGKLIYSKNSELDASDNQVYLFNDVTSDSSGVAYALVTILDNSGLKVTGEQIVKISPDGSRTTIIYNKQYGANDSLIRIGKLQNLYVEGSDLYFFSRELQSATLHSISVDGNLLQYPNEAAKVELPSNRFLKEVTGNPSSPIFYSTKQGFLFSQKGNEITQLYPTADEVTLHFPIEIEVANDHVYYLDQHAGAVMSVSLNNESAAPSPLFTLQSLKQQYDSIEFSSFTDLSLDHGQIIVTTLDHVINIDEDGKVIQIMDSYTYGTWDMAQKIIFWLLVIALIATLIYTIRHVYKVMLDRKVYLLMKQLLLILPVLCICMAWLSYTVYQSVSMEKKEDTFKQLKILAANGKFLVDGDELEQLTSPRDYRTNAFVTIKQRLNEVFSLSGDDREGLYNTIYRYMDGKLYIVMDDDDGVTMFSPFEITEENGTVIDKGEIVLGEWADETGEWMYALGPIYNSAGEVVGIYETGKDMSSVTQSNLALLSTVIEIAVWIGLVLAIVITAITFYFLSSIRKLRRSVNQIASGEWNVQVSITTRDEVEELGDRFNMMTAAIKTYVQEVTKLSNTYFRFVPQQFVKVLGKSNMADVQLGDQQNRNMTILVCHMRGFDEISTKLSTEDHFVFINSFLKRFGPIIREHGGFISRYLGPGMLTMFPNDTTHALMGAYHIRRTLAEYNEERMANGEFTIDIGISLHAGDVMLGIIGEEQRLEGSVVSNHVQLALDLERLSEKLGVSVLLTAEAREGIDFARAEYSRDLGWIQLSSDSAPIRLYDWYEGDASHIRKLKAETKKQFEQAIEAYRNGRFFDAREGFVQVVKRNRYDLVAKLYFFASDAYYQEGVQLNWNSALKIS